MPPVFHWWGFLKNSEYYFPACCSMYTRESTLYCHGADQYNCRRRRVCVADASSSALRGRDGETQGSVHTLHAKGLYPPPPPSTTTTLPYPRYYMRYIENCCSTSIRNISRYLWASFSLSRSLFRSTVQREIDCPGAEQQKKMSGRGGREMAGWPGCAC